MKKNQFKSTIKNNSKVIENYFFMTMLQVISSLFSIIIYPYLIRVLGAESYGLSVFAMSVTNYFIILISFGFNIPAMRIIAENKDNIRIKSETISSILSAKTYIALIATIIFLIIVLNIPTLIKHQLIFSLSFIQIIAEVLFPYWYYQGVQKMKIVTYIQLTTRLISLPIIFILIKRSDDCWIYVLIVSLTLIINGIVSLFYLIKKERLSISFVPFNRLYTYFSDAMPFFWSSSAGTIKQEGVTLIIGVFFGLRDVALYDLANKIVIIPRMLTTSINSALFPKIINNLQDLKIKKIIRLELFIGIVIIGFIIIFGYWIVLFLGGKPMLESYPLAIILSSTILVWLIVGSYINFIFVPQNRYYFVTQNQIVAFISFFILCIFGIMMIKSIFIVVSALALSGMFEILYCNYLIRKHRML